MAQMEDTLSYLQCWCYNCGIPEFHRNCKWYIARPAWNGAVQLVVQQGYLPTQEYLATPVHQRQFVPLCPVCEAAKDFTAEIVHVPRWLRQLGRLALLAARVLVQGFNQIRRAENREQAAEWLIMRWESQYFPNPSNVFLAVYCGFILLFV